MTTALASLLTGRPVKHTVGMTGEVTLQGRVLPIGGLKQKVLAAHAAGLTDVIIPERNRADLDDVPEDVRNEMSVPSGDEPRRGARAGARAAAGACAVVAARRSPRRSAARRTSSSGAGRSRSSASRTRAPSASTSSSRRSAPIPPATLAQRLADLERGRRPRAAGDRRAPASRRVPPHGPRAQAESAGRRARALRRDRLALEPGINLRLEDVEEIALPADAAARHGDAIVHRRPRERR